MRIREPDWKDYGIDGAYLVLLVVGTLLSSYGGFVFWTVIADFVEPAPDESFTSLGYEYGPRSFCGSRNASVGDNITIPEKWQLYAKRVGPENTTLIVQPSSGPVDWIFNLPGNHTLREPRSAVPSCWYTINVVHAEGAS